MSDPQVEYSKRLETYQAMVAAKNRVHIRVGNSKLAVVAAALAVLAFKDIGEESPMAILLLAIWIAVGFIFRGVSTAVTAISDPGVPGRGWAIFFGVISILAGIVVMASPIDSLVLLAWVVGIWLVVMGVFEIGSAFSIRKGSKKVDDFVEGRAAAGG